MVERISQMAVITIARQFGAGGRALGNMIAEKLDYLLLDDAIIQVISRKAKVSTSSVQAMERTAGGFLSKLLTKAISRNYMERLMGEDIGYLDEDIYVETLREVMTELAHKDNVVLLGRGGQYILRDLENAYHILLVASIEDRIEFMQTHYDMSDARAHQAIIDGSKRRSYLYAKMGKAHYNDPGLYHQVLNMSKLSLGQASQQVCNLVGA